MIVEYIKPKAGDKGVTNKGCEYVVLEYKNAHKIVIEFLPPYQCIVCVPATSLRREVAHNPMYPTVAGRGCIGQGKYSSGSHNTAFARWYSIFRRLYLESDKPSNTSYKDVGICDEWLNFQNFAEWMYNQYLPDHSWHLDKDLIVKGNKTYGPDVCVFLPPEVNVFFTKRKSQRGDTPIGVHYRKKTGMYLSNFTRNSTCVHIGCYRTPEAAFLAYKQAKEQYAKELATKWQSQIDPRAYEALMSYTVEITD